MLILKSPIGANQNISIYTAGKTCQESSEINTFKPKGMTIDDIFHIIGQMKVSGVTFQIGHCHHSMEGHSKLRLQTYKDVFFCTKPTRFLSFLVESFSSFSFLSFSFSFSFLNFSFFSSLESWSCVYNFF